MLTTTKLNQKCKKTELSMILYSPTEMVFFAFADCKHGSIRLEKMKTNGAIISSCELPVWATYQSPYTLVPSNSKH